MKIYLGDVIGLSLAPDVREVMVDFNYQRRILIGLSGESALEENGIWLV
jgi:hypothetical protein